MAKANGSKIAAVGDRDSILLFRSVGARTFAADGQEAVEKAIHRCAREGVAVIYITEEAASLVPETMARYANEPYPMIIPIPGQSGSHGFGAAQIKRNMEKAVGSDIFGD